ncbi:unnamed protein product [Effrenium voratum]|uniref:Uncharacterized protein n=1 Tax=Effrenium voratum TaxID=2562239 RepID=A0AA36MZ47_9DINO|nr:unnamed protein product [Effrenium voratum]
MAVHDVLVEVASVKLSPGTYGSDGARHPSFAFGIARTAVLSPANFHAAPAVCREWAAEHAS